MEERKLRRRRERRRGRGAHVVFYGELLAWAEAQTTLPAWRPGKRKVAWASAQGPENRLEKTLKHEALTLVRSRGIRIFSELIE